MKYRTILEHFKCRLLNAKERFSEMSYVFIELGLRRALYCAAQRLDRGSDPLFEKRLLLLQIGILRCNKVPHHFAQTGYVILRLTMEVAEIFKEFLLRHYPDRYAHVLSLVRQMRNGKDYDSSWGERMSGNGPYAWQIGRRFEIACKRLGLNVVRTELRTDLFETPLKAAQMSLF